MHVYEMLLAFAGGTIRQVDGRMQTGGQRSSAVRLLVRFRGQVHQSPVGDAAPVCHPVAGDQPVVVGYQRRGLRAAQVHQKAEGKGTVDNNRYKPTSN